METLGDANSPVVAAACLPASFLVEGKIHLLPSRLLDPQKESRGGAGDIAADSALETGEGGVVACHGCILDNCPQEGPAANAALRIRADTAHGCWGRYYRAGNPLVNRKVTVGCRLH
mmetsp:Transcript_8513/g.22731  ORF Transcript_8513/g.22731 Transcript_8513/m.22731 type:complete len:117 (+) Transcript_8513:201-551(+)